MRPRLDSLVAVCALVAAGCSSLPLPAEFRVGMTRDEILEVHGPPLREQTVTNTGQAIWGPIEDFWHRVPRGSAVQIWQYRAEGGTVELYFVGDSERVQGTGFAPEGAVFESSGDD